ncbi:type II secretion system protein GspE [Dickeya sp. CFBP 2040]|uniref:Type II secretion system protein E n=1 Tax=Dickeya poaceiphila TaxID=568768 RepID=A0A5B8HRJ9_9GAMM|nr:MULTISPECIES: ATPase, T2SS/T4P/T4SS family [Dickeya]NKI74125.1 type II secretion system protein GspE [Dickeya sp. CFBP 2040]QDX31229.1 type II secretion system protein GspE [Dickeya poaceiphila]
MHPKFSSLEWAKSQGILIEKQDDAWRIYYRNDAHPQAIMSALRHCPSGALLNAIDGETFAERIVSTFQNSDQRASEVMAGLSEDLDMYQLADTLPVHEEILNNDDNPPIIKLINAILAQALKERASDVHIETFEQRVAIRFRLNGVLHKKLEPERRLSSLLVSRLKVMSRLDIAEKRKPQDGRMSLRILGRAVDVRVSVLPSSYGERIVLRLLDKNAVKLDLRQLGMPDAVRKKVVSLVSRPNGIILVTGPTGSGKSSTLYAMINELDQEKLNIMTIEDPVEYDIANISQTQVNSKIGMTFAKGLRAILRQDPDVILIGEIRDQETAQIAVQASMTGHLVLSTLHTNTALSALTRLQDMGIEPFMLASALNAVMAQRLVRCLCPHCRQPVPITTAECQMLNVPWQEGMMGYRPQGCPACFNTGYIGRTLVQALVVINEPMREGIYQQKNENELAALAGSAASLSLDGMNKVLAGLTSIDEVIRVTGELYDDA